MRLKNTKSVWYNQGTLGADLENASVVYKRGVVEKMKEFSNHLREHNRRRMLSEVRAPREEAEERQPTARERALEFARTIKKPSSTTLRFSLPVCAEDTSSFKIDPDLENLERLLEEHSRMEIQVGKIKRLVASSM
jgi:hypothetical protein